MSDEDEHTRLLAGEYEEDDLQETNPSILLLGPLGPSPNAITGPISPDTWVMRPTSTSMQSVEFLTSIRGFQCQCRKCGALATDPVTCSQCGSYGHSECLGLELFQGFPFCAECLCGVIAGYAEHRNRQMRAQWRLSYVEQLATWKTRATNALGLSTAMGTAVGGAAVTVAEAAVGFASGAVAAVAAATTRGRVPVRGAIRDESPRRARRGGSPRRALRDASPRRPLVQSTTPPPPEAPPAKAPAVTVLARTVTEPPPPAIPPTPSTGVAPVPKGGVRPHSVGARPRSRPFMTPAQAREQGHCLVVLVLLLLLLVH